MRKKAAYKIFIETRWKKSLNKIKSGVFLYIYLTDFDRNWRILCERNLHEAINSTIVVKKI